MAGAAAVGAIDIGTNTALLLVAGGSPGAPFAVEERATITRLGKGVDATGRLDDDAIERTVLCLADYGAVLRRHGVTRVEAVCTSAARDAANGAEFLSRARGALGAEVRIIGGAEEAALTFEGALTGLTVPFPVIVFDIGGGSTELIFATRDAAGTSLIEESHSKDVGSVRFTERLVRHDPPLLAELAAIRSAAREALRDLDPRRGAGATLVGVAGTVTTIAAVAQSLDTYDPDRVHGARVTRDTFDAVLARLASLPLAERRQVPGLQPERADVIVAGALIVEAVLDWSGATELVVSDRGVRWGLAARALAAVQRR